jgi:hypothetical protein
MLSGRLRENSVHGSTGLTTNGRQSLNSVIYPFAVSFFEGLLRVFTQSSGAKHLDFSVIMKTRFFTSFKMAIPTQSSDGAIRRSFNSPIKHAH